MPGFSAAPAELTAAANFLHQLATECADHPAVKYSVLPAEVGNDELAAALAGFQRVSADLVGRLTADTMEMADRLSRTAEGYRRADAELARDLRPKRN